MKKVVINKCYGGFSLSMRATQYIARSQGRACYFFKQKGMHDKYVPIDVNDKNVGLFWTAFDVKDPNKVLGTAGRHFKDPENERIAYNKRYEKHSIYYRNIDRTDPLLIEAVEVLGEEANGSYADLEIVEIPDGVQYTIEEYDGMEHIAEVHRTWG